MPDFYPHFLEGRGVGFFPYKPTFWGVGGVGLSVKKRPEVPYPLNPREQGGDMLAPDQEFAAERAAADKNISTYEPGDLILFNPRERPTDHLDTKLSPPWLGPYQVVQQVKNDISVRHIVLQSTAVLHVDRVIESVFSKKRIHSIDSLLFPPFSLLFPPLFRAKS